MTQPLGVSGMLMPKLAPTSSVLVTLNSPLQGVKRQEEACAEGYQLIIDWSLVQVQQGPPQKSRPERGN